MADVDIWNGGSPPLSSYGTRNLVSLPEGVRYVFWDMTGADGIGWMKSTDGGDAWTTITAIATLEPQPDAFDHYDAKLTAAGNPAYSYLAWSDNSQSDTRLRWALFDRSTDTVTVPETTIAFLSPFGLPRVCDAVSIVRARDHALVATAFARVDGVAYTFRSTDGGSTWNPVASLVDSSAVKDKIILWPDFASADPADVLALYWDFDQDELTLKRLDVSLDTVSETLIATGFEAWDTLAANSAQNWNSAILNDGRIVLVAIDVQLQTGTVASLKGWIINGGTVTPFATDVLTAEDYIRAPHVQVDPATNTLRVSYGRDPEGTSSTSMAIFQKTSTDLGATWSPEVQLSTDAIYGPMVGFGDPRPTSGVYQPIWNDNASDDLWTIEAAAAPPIDTPQFRLMLSDGVDPYIPTDRITHHNAAQSPFVKAERGRDRAVLGLPNRAGSMTITSLDNTGLTRYGLLEPTPGRATRLNQYEPNEEAWHHLWTGPVVTPQHEMTVFRPMVDVQAVGNLTRLAGRRVSTALYEGITTGQAIDVVLDAVGFHPDFRDLDAGQVVLLHWWVNDEDALTAINRLVLTEGILANFHEDGRGRLVFRDRTHRFEDANAATPQVAFTSEGAEPRLTGFEYHANYRDIVNEARAVRNVRTDGTPATVVWEDATTPDGTPAQYILAPVAGFNVLTVEATFADPVKDIIEPVEGTDYLLPFGVLSSVVLERTSGQRTRITFTADLSGPGAWLGDLQLRATPVEIVGGDWDEKSSVDAADSIAAYGLLPWQGQIERHLYWYDMRDLLDQVVTWFKDPRPSIRFSVNGSRGGQPSEQGPDGAAYDSAVMTEIATRDINDRITVVETDLGVNVEAWIERCEYEVRSVDQTVATYECSIVGANPVPDPGAIVFDGGSRGFDDQGLPLRGAGEGGP